MKKLVGPIRWRLEETLYPPYFQLRVDRMSVIIARIHVAEDGTFSGQAPEGLPAGEQEAAITVATVPKRRQSVREMPVHDEPWDDRISLRREDMYGDHGR
jgi:hypothetical protein